LGVQFEPFTLLDEQNVKHNITELYHGSPHEFAEGDVVTPKTKRIAHATQSWRDAYGFSHRADASGVSQPSNVYAVTPVDTEDKDATWVQPMKYSRKGSTEVVSSKGFRVLKKIHPAD
jgi:hypothetical protein